MKVILTMIVKNEAHVIERVLNSCIKLIDGYAIVDTGSTDNTKEIIEDFFSKHKRIEGEVLEFPFTTFEECRNKSLELAKNYGDWGFWIDADEELILNNKWNRNEFKKNVLEQKPDELLIDCVYNTLNYQRTQFYRLDSHVWYGPVHEVLQYTNDKKPINVLKFPYGKSIIRAEGASWKTDSISTKYADHAEILLQYQEDNNWEDPRWTFYLAQSYKDAALPLLHKDPKDENGLEFAKKSINFFRDRVNVKKGFQQEIYYSQLMIARLTHYFESPEIVLFEFQKCEEYNTNFRIEHIFEIIDFYRNRNMWKNAKLIGDYAHHILEKQKCDGQLFIESDIYTWRFYDCFSIVLFYNGFANESLKVSDWILNKHSKLMNDVQRKRIEDNKIAITKAIDGQSGNKS